jgi:hypothetical protein
VRDRHGAVSVEGDKRRRPARSTAHELERYGALFAQRTGRMRSSAMRDLLGITERPEVISLAGGLPDTTLFEPELLRSLREHIRCAGAPVRPDGRPPGREGLHRRVDGRRGNAGRGR